MHAISIYRGNRPTHPQTNKTTDRTDYNTLRASAQCKNNLDKCFHSDLLNFPTYVHCAVVGGDGSTAARRIVDRGCGVHLGLGCRLSWRLQLLPQQRRHACTEIESCLCPQFMNGLYTPQHIVLALYSGGDLNHGADTEIFKKEYYFNHCRKGQFNSFVDSSRSCRRTLNDFSRGSGCLTGNKPLDFGANLNHDPELGILTEFLPQQDSELGRISCLGGGLWFLLVLLKCFTLVDSLDLHDIAQQEVRYHV